MNIAIWNCPSCHHLQDGSMNCEYCKSLNTVFIPKVRIESAIPGNHSEVPVSKKIFTLGYGDNHELPENWESSVD